MHKSLQNQLLRAIAAGFALGGCRSGSGDESARPAASPLVPSEAPAPPPTAAAVPSETTEPADAAAVEEPVHSASTSAECAAPAKRTQICYGKRTAPPRQVPYTPSFDADGCVAQREVVNHCNGIQAVYDGPKIQGGKCCYEVCKSPQIPPCGRALLDDDGHARVAAVRDGVGWSAPIVADLPTAARDFWRDNGRLEHASVAAFARFSLELLAIGAPAELVEAAHRAALDEIEHARACFALAGGEQTPAPLSLAGISLRTELAAIVRAAAAECCVGETFAARVAEEALQDTAEPTVRAVLTQIAHDEAQHAALGWRFLAWALSRDPSVRVAIDAGLADGVRALERAMHEATEDAGHNAFGRRSRAQLRALLAQVETTLLQPLTAALDASLANAQRASDACGRKEEACEPPRAHRL